MNRRSFFKTLAAAVAGTVVLPPAITFDRCWKTAASYKKVGGIWVINPEWLNAPYELSFLRNQGFDRVSPVLFKRPEFPQIHAIENDPRRVSEGFPLRCKSKEDSSNGVFLTPWIEAPRYE